MPEKNKHETITPEEVPPDHLTLLSRRYLDWKTGMVIIVGVLLVFTFLNVIATNPTISGLAVVDADTQDTQRFSNMTSLLIIVFAFFGLFLFLITRKLDIRKKL